MDEGHEDVTREKLRENLFSALRRSGILNFVKGHQGNASWPRQSLQQVPAVNNTADEVNQTQTNMKGVDENHTTKDSQHSLSSHTLEDSINILQQEFDARVHSEVAMQVNRIRELEVNAVRLEEAARYRRQLESIHKSGVEQNRAYEESFLERLLMREKEGREEKLDEREVLLKAKEEEVARLQNQLCTQTGEILALRKKELEAQHQDLRAQSPDDHALREAGRLKMNVHRVTEAVEKALSSNHKELMQTLHQRFTVDEDQRLTLINTIHNLEQKLQHYRVGACVSESGTQSRLEERKMQGVDLEDELEQEKVEKQLCQAEINSLQHKLQLKEDDNKKLKATIEELDAAVRDAEFKLEISQEEKNVWSVKCTKLQLTINQLEVVTKNFLQEKDVAERRQGPLEIQLRACESELHETVNLLKRTQEVLEAERLQHYFLRLRTNPLLSLYRFKRESGYPGQQDVLQGGTKSKGDGHKREETPTPLLDTWNVPLECYDDVMPTRGPEITANGEAESKSRKLQNQDTTSQLEEIPDKVYCRREQQSISTAFLQPFIIGTQDEKKGIGQSGADVKEVSNPIAWRETAGENRSDSKALCSESDDGGPGTYLSPQEKAAQGEREISRASEDQSRTQWNSCNSLTRPRSFLDYKKTLVEIGQKLKVEKEARTSILNEESSTSQNEVVMRHDFISRGEESYKKGMEVSTESHSTSQAIPELEVYPTRLSVEDNAGSCSSHKGARTSLVAEEDAEQGLLCDSENRTRANQGTSFRGQGQKSCVSTPQLDFFKDSQTALKSIMSTLMRESKAQESNCSQGRVADDKAHVASRGRCLKGKQCAHLVQGVQEENHDMENVFGRGKFGKEEDVEPDYMHTSETTTENTGSITMQTTLLNKWLAVPREAGEAGNLNGDGGSRWNLEEWKQDGLPTPSSMDEEIISHRWTDVGTKATQQEGDSRTRHGVDTYTDEEEGCESSGDSQSSEEQVEFCSSHRINEFLQTPTDDSLQRIEKPNMGSRNSQHMQTRHGVENSSQHLKPASDRPTRGRTHSQQFLNMVPESEQEPASLAHRQGPGMRQTARAQPGLCEADTQHTDYGDHSHQRKSRMEDTTVQEQPCQSALGGAMQELSELLSLHEASLRERFKHGKRNKKLAAFENENIREKKANWLAYGKRDISKLLASERSKFSMENKSTYLEDTRIDSSSRQSDVKISPVLMGYSTNCDPSDFFYSKRLGASKNRISSEEGQGDHALRAAVTSETPSNVFSTVPVNPLGTGGTSWKSEQDGGHGPTDDTPGDVVWQHEKFRFDLDDALNNLDSPSES